MSVTLKQGDCLEIAPEMDADSVDSIVTDPPYGLSFMGRCWDHGVPAEPFWREFLRVAKPGAHLLAFGGTRTFHRLACAIEGAGWEIRDTVMWVYGQGFPKSYNLKGDFEGWGTTLKPAWEPIIVARKPLTGTVANNMQEHGTGAMNIDACRIGTSKETPFGNNPEGKSITADSWLRKHGHGSGYGPRTQDQSGMNPNIGRWPANLIHDGSDEVMRLFPETGPSPKPYVRKKVADGGIYREGAGRKPEGYVTTSPADAGSAARFFYCAKASKKDRGEDNKHPTVKPTDLMRYLVRLVTPPGGTVLDPFMGSGSTGKAAALEGFSFIGIEREAEYMEIARSRIELSQQDMFAA